MNGVSCLLKSGITTLPVDLNIVAEHYDIRIIDYRTVTEVYEVSTEELYRKYSTQGFSFCDDGESYCAVNENSCGLIRRRWTIAHEIGHIVMGHVGEFGYLPDLSCEKTADIFAAELLAPLCVLHFCGVSSAEELEMLCGISHQAALYRYEELQKLRRQHSAMVNSAAKGDKRYIGKSAFFSAGEDRALFDCFLPFIGEYITKRSGHDNYAQYVIRKKSNPMMIEK